MSWRKGLIPSKEVETKSPPGTSEGPQFLGRNWGPIEVSRGLTVSIFLAGIRLLSLDRTTTHEKALAKSG